MGWRWFCNPEMAGSILVCSTLVIEFYKEVWRTRAKVAQTTWGNVLPFEHSLRLKHFQSTRKRRFSDLLVQLNIMGVVLISDKVTA